MEPLAGRRGTEGNRKEEKGTMRPKRKTRRRKGGKREVVEKRVGTSEAQLSWLNSSSKPKPTAGPSAEILSLRLSVKGNKPNQFGKRKGSNKALASQYREGRKPSRETKSRKKGGSVRQIPRGVGTKRGTYRACKWVRDGLLQGKKAQGQGSVKALRVERMEKTRRPKVRQKVKPMKSFLTVSRSYRGKKGQ
jgi:hypothetical protein